MFSSLPKIFSTGLLSLAAIATFSNRLQAQPNTQNLGLFTESNFDAPPDENNEGLQGGAGGATRGSGKIYQLESCKYTALMPSHGFSTTATSHPTFWLYVVPDEAEEDVFVQASLMIHPDSEELATTSAPINPVENLSSSDATTLGEDNSFITEFLGETETFYYPVALVQERLLEGGLISLTMPQHYPGLSEEKSYFAEISVFCGASEELLAEEVEKSKFSLSQVMLFSVARNAASTIDLGNQHNSEQKSWLDTVDAIARLSRSTDTPTDATTAALLSDWEALLNKITNDIDSL